MMKQERGISGKAALASLLNKEVGSVLSVMNARWSGEQLDHSLVLSLKELRKQLFFPHEIHPAFYLQPFLDVVRSEEADAPITTAALSSVHKVLTSDFLNLNTVSVEEAMHLIVDAVTNCSFEITDPSSEELVLRKVFQVLLTCVKGKTSAVLTDQDLCNVVSSCYRLLRQAASKSELLQQEGGDTMQGLIKCIFSRLQHVTESTQFGVPCMVEILHFLCSLLSDSEDGSSSSSSDEEDSPLFALELISSAIEQGGAAIRRHPCLLSLIQDELFSNLIRFGLSTSPVIISAVSNVVLNLHLHLKPELKLQIEAFVSCVLLRLVRSGYGASYQQQEAGMQALVDFCRHETFMVDIYINLDCDITCSNLFEEVVNVLSECAISGFSILAVEGLVALVHGMAEREEDEEETESCDPVVLDKYTPFWMLNQDNLKHPEQWVSFVRTRKYVKKRLMNAANHFNRDPKKGLEYLQGVNLLPEKLDPESVACFFRYSAGLDKNIVGDFLGNHEDFCVEVLREFARTFDFEDMNVDTALRLFLETFRLPGESQKIQRVLEAFSDRYYEQSPQILASKDAALLLSYSIIMLNTDLHNIQVKNKMSEEDFVRNNRGINDGEDFPRYFLSEIYDSICSNEIRTTPVEDRAGFSEMNPCKWIDLMNRSKKITQYIVPDPSRMKCLHREMFSTMPGPIISALSAVYIHSEDDEHCQTCIDGFLAVAEVSSRHGLTCVVDDVVVSLNHITMLQIGFPLHVVFQVLDRYGSFIRAGWRDIMEGTMRLQKHPASNPETVQKWQLDTISKKSRFLEPESLLHYCRAVRWAARSLPQYEDSAVFCLDALIAVTLSNIERVEVLWGEMYEHVASVLVSNATPCVLVEKAVFGLLSICRRILPYDEEDKVCELLKLVQTLDSRVSEAYCERILEEAAHLVVELKRTKVSQDRLLSHLYSIIECNTYSMSYI